MNTGSEKFYHSLDSQRNEIRLLRVNPGTAEEPLECNLEHVALSGDTSPHYETISYVWGDKTDRGTIYLNGHSMDVHKSAERAVRRMRLPNCSRALWIDAICINQDSITERSQQVSIMHHIYRCGSTNLIWLGDGDEGTIKIVLQDIQSILEDMRADTNDFQNVVETMYTSTFSRKFSDSGLSVQVRDWPSLRDFYSNPWFTRVWIIQEAALAQRNICYHGNMECPLDDILRAASWLFHKHHYVYTSLPGLPRITDAKTIQAFADQLYGVNILIHEQSIHYAFILNLLQELGRFNATDARDHVYGVLGLFLKFSGTEKIPPALMPNYEASLADVFRQASKLCCLESPNLGALMKVSHRSEEDMNGWPTWVPRWERKFDPVQDAVPFDSPTASFQANEGYDSNLAVVEFSECDDLIARGLVESHVASVTPGLRRAQLDSIRGVQDLFQSIDTIASPSGNTRPQPRKHDAFAFTAAFFGCIRLANKGEPVAYHQAFVDYIGETNTLPPRVAELRPSSTDCERKAAQYRQGMFLACLNRRMFATSNGSVGLGPPTTRVGDSIAVLYGYSCRVPYILRPVAVHEAKDNPTIRDYQVVGHCYVYGIMNGEAVERNRLEQNEDVQFQLR